MNPALDDPRPGVSALLDRAILPLTLVGLVGGIVLAVTDRPGTADVVWAVPSVLVGARLAWSIVRDLLNRQAGVDVIAILAIAGALALGETLAAAVIALMLATGQWLERYAEGRAHRELTALLGRAPRNVSRYEDGRLVTRPIDAVRDGDRLLVKPGEVVPVDGIASTVAVLDESAITGEARLVTHEQGDQVASGTVNAGPPFDLRATATAEESTYAGIVRLVREAAQSKAPFVRLADRYALLFVPLALAVSGAAWLLSGDPVRGLAVLVVATPCPLLLAAPIAIVAGISRSARRGIIVKGGGPLETIARASVLLFDKTGTLTTGRPRVATVEAAPGEDPDEVLRLAASLEQVSPHVLASAIVHAARDRELDLLLPLDVTEQAGAGVRGTVGGRLVTVGSAAFIAAGASLPSWARELRRRATVEASSVVFVAVDGRPAGAVVLEDPIRPDTPRAIRALRRTGFSRIVMVTGDHYSVAEIVGAAIGVDGVLAQRTPADKVDAVRDERAAAAGPVVMVGDGINDAPALASADVGVAMGARGATASSEAADFVITVDRLDRLAEAVRIARRSRGIALQSVIVGMGLSLVAMVVAAFGYLPVVAGAVVQEGIDVLVIINALRALGGGLERPLVIPGWGDTSAALREEHRQLAPAMGRIRTLADQLDALSRDEVARQLQLVRRFLLDELVPHEEHEDRIVYPMLAKAAGSDDITVTLHRTHTEIFHLIRLLDRLVEELPSEGPEPGDLVDLRRTLYGLDAILRLHMSQEEELYLSLADGTAEPSIPSTLLGHGLRIPRLPGWWAGRNEGR